MKDKTCFGIGGKCEIEKDLPFWLRVRNFGRCKIGKPPIRLIKNIRLMEISIIS
jgi:hypothetical protein